MNNRTLRRTAGQQQNPQTNCRTTIEPSDELQDKRTSCYNEVCSQARKQLCCSALQFSHIPQTAMISSNMIGLVVSRWSVLEVIFCYYFAADVVEFYSLQQLAASGMGRMDMLSQFQPRPGILSVTGPGCSEPNQANLGLSRSFHANLFPNMRWIPHGFSMKLLVWRYSYMDERSWFLFSYKFVRFAGSEIKIINFTPPGLA